MATGPRFTKTIVATTVPVITDTTLTTIYAANPTYDSRITGINITSDDTSAQNVTLYINDGTTDVPIGFLAVGIGAGTTSVVPVDVIASLATIFRIKDSSGVTIMNLPKGYSLKAKMAVVTGGKKFYIIVRAELYD